MTTHTANVAITIELEDGYDRRRAERNILSATRGLLLGQTIAMGDGFAWSNSGKILDIALPSS